MRSDFCVEAERFFERKKANTNTEVATRALAPVMLGGGGYRTDTRP